jgi:hypothetical protein
VSSAVLRAPTDEQCQRGRSTRPQVRQRVRLLAALTAAVLCLLVVAGSTGLRGAPVGAGDNGDGARLYCGAGLVPRTADQLAGWKGGVVLEFDRAEPCPDPVPSSALLVLRAAQYGDGDGAADEWSLTRLGWTYALITAAVLAAATWAATRRGVSRAAALLPALLPLLDTDTTRFFMSTYSEPAGLLGTFVLVTGIGVVAVTGAADRAERFLGLLLLGLGGVVASTAKPGYAPVLGVAAALCALTVVQWRRRPGRWADRVTGPAVALLAVGAAVGPLTAAVAWQADEYGPVNAHNLTYTLVLTEVPGSSGDLGLPPAAADDAGQAFYPAGTAGVPGAEVVAADPSAARTRAWRVLAGDPAALARALGVAVQATRGSSLDYLPQRAWTPSAVPAQIGASVGPQGARADQLRSWLDGMSAPWLSSALLATGVATGLAGLRRRHAIGTAFTRTAGICAVTALGVAALAVLGDGYFELAKHVWLSAYLLDVTVTATVGAAVTAASLGVRRVLRRRPRAGQ